MVIPENKKWKNYNYNCGGYVLGVEEWVLADHWHRPPKDREFLAEFETQFPQVRRIRHLEELQPNEDLILTRLGRDKGFSVGWDYHFIRVTSFGAFHKQGGLAPDRYPTKNLFKPWKTPCTEYAGKIYYYAIDKDANSWYTENEVEEKGSTLQWLRQNRKLLQVGTSRFKPRLSPTSRQVGQSPL